MSAARTLSDADLALMREAMRGIVREELAALGVARVESDAKPANEVPPTKKRRRRDLSHVVPTDLDYALAARVQRSLGIVSKRR